MYKNLGINLSISILATLIALATIEVLLRLNSVLPGHQSFRRLTNYEFDSTIGWVRKRNWTYLRSTPEYSIYNHYNAQGLPVIKAELHSLKKVNSDTIVFLGDSFVESYYVDYDKSFPQIFNNCYPKHEVFNLGVSGYAPDQEYLLYQREVNTQVSGVYAFFFPRTDIKDSFRSVIYGGYEKPLFTNDHKAITNLPLVKNESAKKFLIDHSSLFYFLQPFLERYTGLHEDRHDYQQTVERVTYAQDEMKFALEFYKMAQERKMHRDFFRVIYIPELMELENKHVYQHNIDIFYKNCSELGLECLAPDYLESFYPYKEHYYLLDRHFNEKGSRKMASFLIGQGHRYPKDSTCQ